MPSTQIKEIMIKNVSVIKPKDKLMKALSIMTKNEHSCILAVDNKKLVGIINERDILKLIIDKNVDVENTKVEDVMITRLVFANMQESIYEIMVLANINKVKQVPVIDERGQLKGIVTQTDLMSAYCKIVERKRLMIQQEIAKNKDLVEANEKLKEMSFEDPMFQIGNRRAMEVDLTHTHLTARRYDASYAIALLDVDFFKPYNDHYGHLEGDKALIKIVDCIKERVRGSDRLYRYGGEEFLLMLPSTSLEDTQFVVNELIKKVEQLKLKHCKSPYNKVTMSAGIACFSELKSKKAGFKRLIEIADERLYKAKHNGRNQLFIEEEALVREDLIEAADNVTRLKKKSA